MKYIFVSGLVPEDMREKLSVFGKVISLPPLKSLPSPIASHPDTLLFSEGDTLFIYSDYTGGAELFSSLGVKFSFISGKAGNVYPNDAALNCFTLGKCLFCRKKSIAPEILLWASENGLCTENVNQGYAKCSSAVFGNSLISADECITEKAKAHGASVLRISGGGVSLEGYDCGFIGGACGLIDDTLVFFGDPLLHGDGTAMNEFIKASGFRSFSLSPLPLCDFGGMTVINA